MGNMVSGHLGNEIIVIYQLKDDDKVS